MSSTKVLSNDWKKQVVFVDSEPPRNNRIVRKTNTPISNYQVSSRKTSNKPPVTQHRSSLKINHDTIAVKQLANNTNTIDRTDISSTVSNTKQNELQPKPDTVSSQKSVSDENESLNGTITSELGTIGNNPNTVTKTTVLTSENENEANENQATLDLLSKIRQGASAASIGPMPLSQRACRFELPFDLKLLETLTPLEYLSKYCRLSSRRQYQFKRMFDKYRTERRRFDSSYLYLSILNIHQENFTHVKFEHLCQLIGLDNQQYYFTFDTYAGILALCERVLYNTSDFYRYYQDDHLTKDIIEKCDFDSLNRKLDGLAISNTMRRLLHAL